MILNLLPCLYQHGSNKFTGAEIRCPHLRGYVNAFPFSLIYSNANAGEEKSMVNGTWPFFDNYTRKVR